MDREDPLVSIIIRTKDRPKLLVRALQSIAAQTYRPINAVLVNDGGCDLNIEELKTILGDVSINYIRLEENTGRSHAGNVGIENAKGEYIGFLDDDDELYPEHIAKLIDAMKNAGGILVAYSGIRVVDAKNATIKNYDEPFDLTRLRGANFLPIHAILFSRTLVQTGCRFDESLECLEDWDFWLQLAERTHFLHVPRVSAIYHYDLGLGDSELSKNAKFETHLTNRALLFSKWNQRYSPREWVETQYLFEKEWEHYLNRASELEKGIHLRDGQIIGLQAEKASFKTKLAELEAEAHHYREWVNTILSSKSWKLTAPLRWVRRFICAVFNRGRLVSSLASLRVAIAKTYWYYRKSGLKATVRRVKAELRFGSYHSKSLGSSLRSPELLDIVDVQPLSGGNPGRIAVHAHVYYPDLTKELASYLKNIPFKFDLFVSVPTDGARDICYQVFSKLPRVSRVIVDVVENRGRDIAPMVCHFGAQLAKYVYFCHIHTKKSIYTQGRMVGWREYIFRQLLGSEDQVRRIFSLLLNNPDAGIIYPQNYEHFPYWGNTWLSNRALGSRMCRQMEIKDVPEGYFDYPAGSMFWARSKAIQNLFSAGIKLADFPPEAGQTDGTMSHCIERLLPLAAKQAGYTPLILRDPFCPSWSKWRFDRYMARTRDYVNRMMLEADDIKVVAFDIFDTLLVRPVIHPETTKTIIEHRLRESGGSGYAGLRAHAEGLARSRLGRDVGLEDIYSEFASLTGKQVSEVEHLRALE
jgi:glycosyltransferase involved in cell wall biosynthesis